MGKLQAWARVQAASRPRSIGEDSRGLILERRRELHLVPKTLKKTRSILKNPMGAGGSKKNC
eukprot:11272056-Karenia_brevis.AAC.1